MSGGLGRSVISVICGRPEVKLDDVFFDGRVLLYYLRNRSYFQWRINVTLRVIRIRDRGTEHAMFITEKLRNITIKCPLEAYASSLFLHHQGNHGSQRAFFPFPISRVWYEKQEARPRAVVRPWVDSTPKTEIHFLTYRWTRFACF